LGSQALKGNVTSLGAGLGYFGVGAAAGALYLTPGGQAVAGSVQVVGNKGIQIATGRFDVTEINSVGDVAYLGLDIAIDYFSVAPAAKIGSNLASGLQKLAGSYGSSIASGGGAVIKTGVGGSVDDIVFSVSLSDEVVVTASKLGGKGVAAKGVSSTIYRAVSRAELDDIAKFGFRNKAGAYETGKLFAPTAKEAAQFGRNNFMFDGVPNHIMKVRVPNSLLNSSYRFGADGMNAISIPANKLHLLKGSPLNYTPLFR